MRTLHLRKFDASFNFVRQCNLRECRDLKPHFVQDALLIHATCTMPSAGAAPFTPIMPW
jgi:hypothetical protein